MERSVRSTAITRCPTERSRRCMWILVQIVAHDGTIYATVLAPFTLIKIESVKAVR